MIIFLSDEHKDHLKILHTVSVPVLVDFCKLSWDFLQNGPNHKKYQIAAQKLQVEDIAIQNIVHALMFLLLEGCKYNLSENEFKMSLSMTGFSAEHQDILLKFYISKKSELSFGLYKLKDPCDTYQDMNWRFEVQICSKYSKELKPSVMMDLVLKTSKDITDKETLDAADKTSQDSNGTISKDIDNARTASECENNIKHVYLECDLPNLLNMTSKLEQAIQESKSQHVRKIQRAYQRK